MTEIVVKENAPAKEKTEKIAVPKSPTKFSTFFKTNWALMLIILGSILIIGATGAFTYFFIIKVPKKASDVLKITTNYVETASVTHAQAIGNLSAPAAPRTEESPLNGELFTKEEMAKMLKRRPVAVMINNHVAARPQSSLPKADIVYEAVTESGITRYMAIFWSEGPNKVGPIRSARQYFIEWLSPFDPLYIHDGCASTDDPRTNACGNLYTYNIKDLRTIGYWRVYDRYAPHNEYNSVVNAWEYAETRDWDNFPKKTESLEFKKDATYSERGTKTKFKVRFRTDMPNYGSFDAQWTYNRDTNLYYRMIGGAKDIDLETNKQITAKTVIIEEVKMIDAYDGKGRVIITTTGEGNAKIFRDGKILSGKWKKSSRTDRTNYYDSSGNKIEINRGLIWIMALPKTQGKLDIIEK